MHEIKKPFKTITKVIKTSKETFNMMHLFVIDLHMYKSFLL